MPHERKYLLLKRVIERMRAWGVKAEHIQETPSSFIVFGWHGGQSVVLKVIRQPGDEWHSGKVLSALQGNGFVRVYEFVEGAMLLERLQPGNALAELALSGRDEEATEILAELMLRMAHPRTALTGFVTVEQWGEAFERYLVSDDRQLAREMVEEAQKVYAELGTTQRNVRLLHGDLQHYNVLFDWVRGWTAIDPKGVVGELEYEIGASLRNPYERPELFTAPVTIARRLKQYETCLKLDAQRALGWSFAQAVLSAIWSVEDGYPVEAHTIKLVCAMRSLLSERIATYLP